MCVRINDPSNRFEPVTSGRRHRRARSSLINSARSILPLMTIGEPIIPKPGFVSQLSSSQLPGTYCRPGRSSFSSRPARPELGFVSQFPRSRLRGTICHCSRSPFSSQPSRHELGFVWQNSRRHLRGTDWHPSRSSFSSQPARPEMGSFRKILAPASQGRLPSQVARHFRHDRQDPKWVRFAIFSEPIWVLSSTVGCFRSLMSFATIGMTER